MGWVKNLWHDPVLSKVIAGVILLILGTVGAYFHNSFFTFATAETRIANWQIALFTVAIFAGLALQFNYRRRKSTPVVLGDCSTNLYLKRQQIHWVPFNNKTRSRYWAAGTSLIGVAERNLIQIFHNKGIRDIKVLLPATEQGLSSFIQLDQYDRLTMTPLVNKQVDEAELSYNKLIVSVKAIAHGKETDIIKRYSGIMYSNITIFDDEAFIAFYDRTGVGDNITTIHFNKHTDQLGYEKVEEEFLSMWNADPYYGKIPSKKKGTSIIFVNSQANVLLFLRDNKEEIPFPNRWDILGGNVESDESPEKCIQREMSEELNVRLVQPQIFNVYDMDDRLEYTFWQEAEFDISKLNLTEGQRLKWFSEDDIRRMADGMIAFNFRHILLEFFQKKPWLDAGIKSIRKRK